MMDDVILNKKESIERCIKQARAFHAQLTDLPFEQDLFKQDAVSLNVQRAVEQAIALANHVVKKRKLGLPKESRESFRLLESAGIVPAELSQRLQSMIGFRNVLVHEYQQVDAGILVEVINLRLDDLIEFTNCVLKAD